MIEKLRKKLFITGGKGFLGSAIIERLLVAGYELRLLVRPDGEKTTGYGYLPENHSSVKDNAQYFGNIEIYEGDITSPFLGLGQCVYDRLAVEIDEVFHCAAATHFESSGAGELNTINVHGTENVLRFAHEGRIKRFHYISTAYVAGKQNCTVYEDELTNEPTFNNEYEKTKFLAEKMVIEYSRSNRVPYTIYRPGIIVGDSTTGFTCKFENVYTFIKVMLNIRNGGPHKQRGMDDVPGGIVPGGNVEKTIPVRVPGDPEAFVNLVPIDYVADAIVEILRNRETVGKIFHIVNHHPPTISELRDLLVAALDIKDIRLTIDGKIEGSSLRTEERLFFRQTRTYYSYLFSRLRFDSTNTREALKGTNIQCPSIDYDVLKILIDFALSHNWGERHSVCGKSCAM